MNYTPTKVGNFWKHEVVFKILHVYSRISSGFGPEWNPQLEHIWLV